jgi:hypothetical protein
MWRRNHVLETFEAALLLITASQTLALQTVVTQVDKKTDKSKTSHFAIKLEQGDALATGESKSTADFISEEFDRTPTWNRHPKILHSLIGALPTPSFLADVK